MNKKLWQKEKLGVKFFKLPSPPREKRIKLPHVASSRMFDKKVQGINIVQIKPIFKIILHFRFDIMNGMLWETNNQRSNFPMLLCPLGRKPCPPRRRIFNCHGRKSVGKITPKFSFFDNFMFITSKIKHHFRHPRWKSFPMIYKMFDLNNICHLSFLVKHLRIFSPREVAPRGIWIPFSYGEKGI